MSTDAKRDSRPGDASRVSRRVQSADLAKDVLMPDIYADENAVEETDLEVAEETSPVVNESVGFNPYDTGTLYKK